MPSATHRSDCRRRLASSPPAQSWGGWWTAAVVALAVAVLLVPQLPADDTNDDTVFLPHDRAASQRLIKARELLADRRYSEAVRLLSAILDAPEDVFITRSKDEGAAADGSFRSLKSEAERLLGELDVAGRDAYETQFGATARKLLEQAIDAGDADALANVSRRFFHTAAGYEATFVLGSLQLEQGRTLESSLSFERLLATSAARSLEPMLSIRLAISLMRNGHVREAVERLAAVGKDHADARLTIGGRRRTLLDVPAGKARTVAELWQDRPPRAGELAALAWLQDVATAAEAPTAPQDVDWPMFRGEPTRNALSSTSQPLLNRRWEMLATNDPRVLRLTEQLAQSYVDQETPSLPAIQPIVLGDYAYTRSVQGLVAVDLRTGKRVWTGSDDDAARTLLEHAGEFGARPGRPDTSSWLIQRLWGDGIYGMLSSDGESVFCVEDLTDDTGTVRATGPGFAFRVRATRGTTGKNYNRLASYRIASEGKLDWELGGPGGDDSTPLAGAYFLGPPLPLDDRLYVLAEIKGEIRLVALRRKPQVGGRGLGIEVEWSQQLALLEQAVLEDPSIRLAGAMPSYQNGVLICPTSAGAVVAIDLVRRSLLWGFHYPRNGDNAVNANFGNPFASSNASAVRGSDRWFDASIVLADDVALVTPIESTSAFCLDLRTGKVRWKCERGEDLYLAGAAQGAAVFVGRTALRAVDLKTGNSRWTAPLPSHASPSGRGLMTAEAFHLPLSSGEVQIYSLRDGKPLARAKSRTGSVPGNLVAHQGMVLSQTARGLECFYQVDELRRHIAERLAAQADDPQAQAFEGELALEAGRIDEALMLLRTAYERTHEPRTGRVLLEAVLTGLRTDFAQYRATAQQLESLFDEQSDRLAFFCAMTTGMLQAGRLDDAFTYLTKVVDLPAAERSTPVRMQPGWSVHPDRWVRAQLAELQAQADPDQQRTLAAALRRRLDSALAAADASMLRSFVETFGEHPLADEAREALVQRSLSTATLLEIEQWLLPLIDSSDPVRARAAVAQMALQLKQAQRLDDAGPLVERLRSYGDQVCLDGRTANDIVAELFPASSATPAWPQGVVRVEPLKGQPMVSIRTVPLDIEGPRGWFFNGAEIELDQSQPSLIGRDSLARERWRASLADPSGNFAAQWPQLSHVRLSGHIALVSMGMQLVAVDTLPGKQGPRVLWREELGDLVSSSMRAVGWHMQNESNRKFIQQRRQRLGAMMGIVVGELGPVGRNFVCYQRQHNLIAVHPMTGRVLWVRHGVAPQSEIFGGDQRLYVKKPSSNELLVLRALDGAELGRRTLPAESEMVIAGPQHQVLWEPEKGQRWLRCRDLWNEKIVWERRLAGDAIGATLDDRLIGIMANNGTFDLVRADDGKALIDNVKLDRFEGGIPVLALFETKDRWLAVASREATNVKGESYEVPVNGLNPPPLINGYVYGFDRSNGKQLFATRVENRHLVLQQGADLPVLVFASHIQKLSRPGGATNLQGAILCVDKRHGRVVYNERLSSVPIQALIVSGDVTAHSVTVRSMRHVVRLTWTDEAWPADAAAPTPKAQPTESFPARATRALGRGVQKFFEDLSPPVVP